jgi:hypothetical protein
MKRQIKVSSLREMVLSFLKGSICLVLISPSIILAQAPVLDWAHASGETGISNVRSIKRDAGGNKFLLGDFDGCVDFDPGPAFDKKRSTKTEKLFLTKLDQNNNYLWTKRFAGVEANNSSCLAIDASGNVYVSTSFVSTTDPDPSAFTQTLVSYGDRDAVLIKLGNNGNYIWSKRVGGNGEENGKSVVSDPAGNIYFFGNFSSVANCDPGGSPTFISSAGDKDIFMIKYNSSGGLIWSKSFGGKKNEDINGAALDQSGNILLTGGFRDTCDFNPGVNTYTLVSPDPFNQTSDAIFVAKFDNLASLVWAKSYAGDGPEWGQAVTTDKNDDIIVTGSLGSSSVNFGTGVVPFSGTTDAFVLKLDANGNTSWALSLGNISGDNGNSVCVDDSNNVYCTGSFSGNIDFDPGTNSAFINASELTAYIAKYSPTGIHMWSKKIEGGSQGYDISVGATELSISGCFYRNADMDPGTSVFQLNGSVNSSAFFLSLDMNGSFNTAKHFYSEWGTNYFTDMKADISGNIYLSGYMTGTLDMDPSLSVNTLTVGVQGAWPQVPIIAKYDNAGIMTWIKALQGKKNLSGYAFSNAIDNSGNIYIAGIFTDTIDFDPGPASYTIASKGNFDLYIAKYDNSGNFLWAGATGAAQEDRAQYLTLDASGNIFLTGYFSGTVDFDLGTGVQNITSADPYRSMFVAKYDNAGNYIWAKCVGSAGGWAYPNAMKVDNNNDVVIGGRFNASVDFDPGAGVFSLTDAVGNGDIFIAKYNTSGNFLWAKQIGGSFTDECMSVTTDMSNNIYTTGYFEGTVDFDPSSVVQNLNGNPARDAYVQKLDQNGNYIWAKGFGGKFLELGRSVDINASGDILIGGYTTDTLDLDPGPGTDMYYPENYKGFVSKFDNSGNYIWGRVLEGRGWSSDITKSLFSNTKIYTTGYFQQDADLDVNTGVYEVSSAMPAGFLASFNECNISQSPSLSASSATLCAPAPVNLSLSGGTLNAASSWQWYEGSCGFNPVGTGTLIVVTPTVTTTYYVSGSGGCAGPASNCVGITVVVGECVGVSENTLSADEVSIYPNPFTDSFTICLPSGDDEYSFEIYSETGSLVKTGQIRKTAVIEMNEESSGIYFLRIGNSESSFSKKIIKYQ